MEETMREFMLGGERWTGETEVARVSSFTSQFDSNEFTWAGWFGFMEETVSSGDDFELYTLLDRKPMKRFE